MRRLAATLAGLALVIIPSAFAMSSAGSSATTAPSLVPASQTMQNAAPSQYLRGGHHCHHQGGATQQQSSGGQPDV
jgi:hypothetical protein